MKLTTEEKTKGPGPTIVKILCFTLLVAIAVVAFIPYGEIDKWMKNIEHQLYTFIALVVILFVSWLVWVLRR